MEGGREGGLDGWMDGYFMRIDICNLLHVDLALYKKAWTAQKFVSSIENG